MKNSRVQYKL